MKWAFSLFFILLRRIRGLAFVIDEKREKILLVLEAGEITKGKRNYIHKEGKFPIESDELNAR